MPADTTISTSSNKQTRRHHAFVATPVNHIGITVTDVVEAIDFYSSVLGYRLIAGPLEIAPDNSHFGRLSADIFDERLRTGRLAHLLSPNGVGLELFDFDDPQAGRRDKMEYWRNGVFHICVTTPDIDATIARIEMAGGSRRTRTWEIFPDAGRYLAYAEDPFGNPIELYTHTYEETWILAAAKDATAGAFAESDGPVTLVFELKTQRDHADKVREMTRAVFPKALAEPYAETIELFQDPADPSRILVIEQWGSRAYVTSDAHTKADHLTSYIAAIGPLLAEPPRWAVWDRTERHLSDRGIARAAAE